MHKRLRGGFALILAATVAIVATMGIVAILCSPTPFSAGTSLPSARAIHGRLVSTTTVSQNCVASQDVLERLETDREATGGRLVLLSGGLQQSLSDVWRRKAHA